MNVIIFMSIVAFSSILASATTSTAAAPISNGHDQKELLALLRAHEFETLESATRQVQEQFEKGALSDIQLRNTYRQFYDLDEQDLAKIEEWKNTIPGSYAAHLILVMKQPLDIPMRKTSNTTTDVISSEETGRSNRAARRARPLVDEVL